MADLIGKLNVLVRSSIHGVLGDDAPGSKGRRTPPPLSRLGPDIDREIAALRQQIDNALDHEEKLKADIESLSREAADWDRQADEAVANGDDPTARYAVRQMQIKQQHVTLLEADLAQHRFSAAELISRVNELEAVVAEARRQQQQTQDDPAEPSEGSLSSRLRKARQMFQTQEMNTPQTESPSVAPIEDHAIEDDLARRRARLSE